jgi:hypothetical protein
VFEPFFEIFAYRCLGRLQRVARFEFRNEPGAFDLRLPLGALERVPLSAPLKPLKTSMIDLTRLRAKPKTDRQR